MIRTRVWAGLMDMVRVSREGDAEEPPYRGDVEQDLALKVAETQGYRRGFRAGVEHTAKFVIVHSTDTDKPEWGAWIMFDRGVKEMMARAKQEEAACLDDAPSSGQ